MTRPNESTRLRDAARELVAEAAKTKQIKDIAIECQVPRSWLNRFHLGHTPDPSVNRIEAVIERLTGRKIVL